MKRLAISLRYKFLIALTALPLIALSLFLSLAINVFEKDKIAYIFDSSLSVSKTKAERVRADVGSLISMMQSLVMAYQSDTRTLAESGRYYFQREARLDMFQIHTLAPGSGNYAQPIDLKKDHTPEVDPALLQRVIKEARESNFAIAKVPGVEKSVLFGLRFGELDDPNHLVSVSLVQARELVESFNESGGTFSLLLRGSGITVFAPPLTGTLAGLDPMEVWSQLSARKVPEGIAEVKGPGQTRFLASYVSVGVGEMHVISLVDRKTALNAISLLLRQSFLFFIALLAFTMIVSVLASKRLTSALHHLFVATKKVSEGHFDVRVKAESSDEIGSLAESFNRMAEEVSRLMLETAEKARMESELATARTVQETLFPENSAQIGPVQIAGHYQPASECGGDWWYYCENGDSVYLWIGDATGHGAPAALLTSAARAVASVIEAGPPISPGAALSLLNRAICDTSKGKMMMTFFLAVINKNTGVMSYTNASHEAPLLLKRTEVEPKRKDYLPLNDINNPRLGEQPGHKFIESRVQLEAGDRIVFYTDGVVDVKNTESTVWGERRFLKSLSQSLFENSESLEALGRVIIELHEFRQEVPLDDDVTLVVCKYDGAA